MHTDVSPGTRLHGVGDVNVSGTSMHVLMLPKAGRTMNFSDIIYIFFEDVTPAQIRFLPIWVDFAKDTTANEPGRLPKKKAQAHRNTWENRT